MIWWFTVIRPRSMYYVASGGSSVKQGPGNHVEAVSDPVIVSDWLERAGLVRVRCRPGLNPVTLGS